jgi:hypothetical protein
VIARNNRLGNRTTIKGSGPGQRVAASAGDGASDGEVGAAGLTLSAIAAPLNAVVLFSEYTLVTTGEGLPPGPGGLYGAAEGVGYLVVLAMVAWSLKVKLSTGAGLPPGPGGLVGASEGLSYLSLLGAIGAFGWAAAHGGVPGPLGN